MLLDFMCKDKPSIPVEETVRQEAAAGLFSISVSKQKLKKPHTCAVFREVGWYGGR